MSSKVLLFFSGASNVFFCCLSKQKTEHNSCISTAGWIKMFYTGQSKLDKSQSTEFGSSIVLTISSNEYALWEWCIESQEGLDFRGGAGIVS